MGKSFVSQAAKRFTSADIEADGEIRYIAPLEIKTEEPFKNLFAIRYEVHSAIVADMTANGYDNMQPVLIWKEKGILIDGHTRLKAAIETGLKQVAYIEKPFESEQAALDYMYHIQFSRRNITDSELLPLAMQALERYEKKYGEGGKAEFLAKRFTGLSVGKAKKLIAVLDNATNVQLTDIIQENATISATYKNLKMVHVNHFEKDKITPKEDDCDEQMDEPTTDGSSPQMEKYEYISRNFTLDGNFENVTEEQPEQTDVAPKQSQEPAPEDDEVTLFPEVLIQKPDGSYESKNKPEIVVNDFTITYRGADVEFDILSFFRNAQDIQLFEAVIEVAKKHYGAK